MTQASAAQRETRAEKRGPRGRLGRLLEALLGIALFVVPLFGGAGRLDWTAGWLYLGGWFAALTLLTAFVRRKQPDLIRQRALESQPTSRQDKLFFALYVPMIAATLAVSALDAGRFGWSSPGPAARLLGALALAACLGVGYWAMWVNPFLLQVVRVQEERGHRVVDEGPYRFIRHPLYAAAVLAWLGTPLVLGSWWGLVPGALAGVLFALRTGYEERLLAAELPGYAEYKRRVRYRLVPGVW